MKVFSIWICIMTLVLNVRCQAQKKADSATVAYMLESVKSIKTFSEKDIFYTHHGKITYNGKNYTIYTFGFNPVKHEPYHYILFYECSGCVNTVLGKENFLDDVIELNRFYLNSQDFSKEMYIELFNDLKSDYQPEKEGKVIDRKDFNKK